MPDQPQGPDDRSTTDEIENEGEGSRTAARRYNEDVRAFVARDQSPMGGRAAAGALDGPEGPSLRAAEDDAKRVGQVTLFDRLKGLYHRARNAIVSR
jgi:hypothetical protein